nr:MAG TPA: hypothetical protein [Caudoviricetes sp.]
MVVETDIIIRDIPGNSIMKSSCATSTGAFALI